MNMFCFTPSWFCRNVPRVGSLDTTPNRFARQSSTQTRQHDALVDNRSSLRKIVLLYKYRFLVCVCALLSSLPPHFVFVLPVGCAPPPPFFVAVCLVSRSSEGVCAVV